MITFKEVEHSADSVKTLIAVAGLWTFSSVDATYERPDSGGSHGGVVYGLALSNAQLLDGSIEATIEFKKTDGEKVAESSAGIVLGYGGENSRYIIASLGGHDWGFNISSYDPKSGWRHITGGGSIENLVAGKPYSLQVTQRGQKLLVAIDGVRVLNHLLEHPLSGNQVGLCAFGRTPVVFSDISVAASRPKVFVAMPFKQPFDTLYANVIRPVAMEEEFNLDVQRIDEKAGPGIIFKDIQNEIADSKIVVAEITDQNDNVFYELGYAHALNKPTILLARRNKEQLPFDIRSYRVIFYDDTIGGKPQVEDELRKHFRAILKDV